jgi:hypothetical protein
MRRPFGVVLLAIVLAGYAMAGVALAATMATTRDSRLRWDVLAAAGALFAVTAGAATLSLWRLERRAPVWVALCGVCGTAVCLLIPAVVPMAPGPEARAAWRSAIAGGVLFAAFLLVAAWYVHRQVNDGSAMRRR